MKVAGALTDESSNSERELQVQIPWQCTLALLGRNMLHSTAHLLHRYGLLSFYWMFTPRGIGSILLKFRSLLPLLTCCCSCSSTTSVTFPFHTAHPNQDNISITFQAWSGGRKMIKVPTFQVSISAALVFSGIKVVFTTAKKSKKQLIHFILTFYWVTLAQWEWRL